MRIDKSSDAYRASVGIILIVSFLAALFGGLAAVRNGSAEYRETKHEVGEVVKESKEPLHDANGIVDAFTKNIDQTENEYKKEIEKHASKADELESDYSRVELNKVLALEQIEIIQSEIDSLESNSDLSSELSIRSGLSQITIGEVIEQNTEDDLLVELQDAITHHRETVRMCDALLKEYGETGLALENVMQKQAVIVEQSHSMSAQVRRVQP